MNTWNKLPPRYWEKVLATVRASLNASILRDAGVNSTPPEAIDTRGIAYNRVAMEALLEEPDIEQPNISGAVDIPAAREVYFDAENGVGPGDDGTGGPEEETVTVEAEAEPEVALEEVGEMDDGGDLALGSEEADEEGGEEDDEEQGEEEYNPEDEDEGEREGEGEEDGEQEQEEQEDEEGEEEEEEEEE